MDCQTRKESDFGWMTAHAKRQDATCQANRVNNLDPIYYGSLDTREAYQETLKKIKQETGLEVQKHRLRGEWIEPDYNPKDFEFTGKIPKYKGRRLPVARYNKDGRLRMKHSYPEGTYRWNAEEHKIEQYVAQQEDRDVVTSCIFTVSPEFFRGRDENGNFVQALDKEGKPYFLNVTDENDLRIKGLMQKAEYLARQVFGLGYMRMRYDRDERGAGVVDVDCIPINIRRRGNTNEIEISHYAAIDKWRERRAKKELKFDLISAPINKTTGERYKLGSKRYAAWLGELLQDAWHEECKEIFPTIERGKSKDITKRENQRPLEFKLERDLEALSRAQELEEEEKARRVFRQTEQARLVREAEEQVQILNLQREKVEKELSHYTTCTLEDLPELTKKAKEYDRAKRALITSDLQSILRVSKDGTLPDLAFIVHSASELIKQQNRAFTFLRDQFVQLAHRLAHHGVLKLMDDKENKSVGSFWSDLLKVGQEAGERFPLLNAAKNMYTFLRNKKDWEQHKHPERRGTRERTRTPFS